MFSWILAQKQQLPNSSHFSSHPVCRPVYIQYADSCAKMGKKYEHRLAASTTPKSSAFGLERSIDRVAINITS